MNKLHFAALSRIWIFKAYVFTGRNSFYCKQWKYTYAKSTCTGTWKCQINIRELVLYCFKERKTVTRSSWVVRDSKFVRRGICIFFLRYLGCTSFLEKSRSIIEEIKRASTLEIFFLGNFYLSGEGYSPLLSVIGCCFCCDILSLILLPSICRHAVSRGLQWWALNDRSFANSLLVI